MNSFRNYLKFAPILVLVLMSGASLANGPELKFTSVISSVNQTNSESGVVEINIQALAVPIVVNGDTEIKYQSEHIGLSELSAGDLVEVEAFFSDEGITADEIEILDSTLR